jgi:hypothetical protein
MNTPAQENQHADYSVSVRHRGTLIAVRWTRAQQLQQTLKDLEQDYSGSGYIIAVNPATAWVGLERGSVSSD